MRGQCGRSRKINIQQTFNANHSVKESEERNKLQIFKMFLFISDFLFLLRQQCSGKITVRLRNAFSQFVWSTERAASQLCASLRARQHTHQHSSIFNGAFHAFYLYLNPSSITIFNFTCVGFFLSQKRFSRNRNKFLLPNNLKALRCSERSVLISRLRRDGHTRAGVYDAIKSLWRKT